MKAYGYMVLLAGLCLGCGKSYRFSEDDLRWQPYKGGELLVFQSDSGELDSIWIGELPEATMVSNDHDWQLFPDKFEVVSVRARFSDPSPPAGTRHRYLKGSILRLSSSLKEEELSIDFMLTAKNAKFYGSTRKKSALKQIDLVELRTTYRNYEDIIIIESEDREYREKEHFIERIYWSMSDGYVRYDLKGGAYWQLIDKTSKHEG